MSTPKIKICGLTRVCDIAWVNAYRPDYAGFVFAKSRRQVTDEQAATLKQQLSSTIAAVGVFVNDTPEHILSLVQRGVIDVIQLHGQEDEDTLRYLKHRAACPVIRAVSMSTQSVEAFAASQADFLLLDNGAGGTGQRFDWSRTADIPKPFFLAGGLNIDNVAEGIRRFHPFGVDISGGVETDGYKDETKIKNIIRRIRYE